MKLVANQKVRTTDGLLNGHLFDFYYRTTDQRLDYHRNNNIFSFFTQRIFIEGQMAESLARDI